MGASTAYADRASDVTAQRNRNREARASRKRKRGPKPASLFVQPVAQILRPQHSTIFTANPPREVSLYLVFISAPVCIIVLITESSDT